MQSEAALLCTDSYLTCRDFSCAAAFWVGLLLFSYVAKRVLNSPRTERPRVPSRNFSLGTPLKGDTPKGGPPKG